VFFALFAVTALFLAVAAMRVQQRLENQMSADAAPVHSTHSNVESGNSAPLTDVAAGSDTEDSNKSRAVGTTSSALLHSSVIAAPTANTTSTANAVAQNTIGNSDIPQGEMQGSTAQGEAVQERSFHKNGSVPPATTAPSATPTPLRNEPDVEEDYE
jgi:hypothetical protein